MQQNLNFVVGERAVFRQTSGEYVSHRVYGTVMAVGQQVVDGRTVDGALVAWDGYNAGMHGVVAPTVSFVPFWNSRFSAMPEPELPRSTRRRGPRSR